MSSGAWFRAKPVMKACNFAMDRQVAEWVRKHEESIELRMARGRWSWREFRQVPLTRAEAKAEGNTYCDMLQHFINNPMENQGYAAMQKLLSVAAQAEKLVAGSQVFVSAEDHWRISSALYMVENNDRVRDGVPRDGDRLQ